MKDWIPLFQTLIDTGLPILVIVFIVLLFRKKVLLVIDLLITKIRSGASVKIGSFEIGTIPESVRSGKTTSATSEGSHGVDTPENIKDELLNRHYPSEITEDIYLVHVTQEVRPYTGPRTGLWHVRAYIEAYEDDNLLDEIVRVTYRLHDTFNPKVMTTQARKKSFELWISIYGEFNLIAYVERKNKPPLWLTRYIDLPGRPTN